MSPRRLRHWLAAAVTNYRNAIAWGTAWTVAGAMVATFSKGLLQIEMVIPPALGLSVLSGAIIWVLIASCTGLPVSTTHALTGARSAPAWSPSAFAG